MINLQEAESVIPFQLNGIVPRLFKLSYLKTYTKKGFGRSVMAT